MIELFPNTSLPEPIKMLKRHFKSPAAARKELASVHKHFIESDLRETLTYEMVNAKTADGRLYERVEFVVTARYTELSDEFIAGSGFIVNFSEAHKELSSAIEAWQEE